MKTLKFETNLELAKAVIRTGSERGKKKIIKLRDIATINGVSSPLSFDITNTSCYYYSAEQQDIILLYPPYIVELKK